MDGWNWVIFENLNVSKCVFVFVAVWKTRDWRDWLIFSHLAKFKRKLSSP